MQSWGTITYRCSLASGAELNAALATLYGKWPPMATPLSVRYLYCTARTCGCRHFELGTETTPRYPLLQVSLSIYSYNPYSHSTHPCSFPSRRLGYLKLPYSSFQISEIHRQTCGFRNVHILPSVLGGKFHSGYRVQLATPTTPPVYQKRTSYVLGVYYGRPPVVDFILRGVW